MHELSVAQLDCLPSRQVWTKGDGGPALRSHIQGIAKKCKLWRIRFGGGEVGLLKASRHVHKHVPLQGYVCRNENLCLLLQRKVIFIEQFSVDILFEINVANTYSPNTVRPPSILWWCACTLKEFQVGKLFGAS
jgi:hypothetical protein